MHPKTMPANGHEPPSEATLPASGAVDEEETALAAFEIDPKALSIPSLPSVVLELNERIRDPDAGVMEIADLLAQDPDLSTRVLRTANSALFSLREPVLDPRHAASILGLERLRSIILQATTVNLYGRRAAREDVELNALWRHSILTAQLAKIIGQTARHPELLAPEELYTCGLLHDIGRAVLLDGHREELLGLRAHADREGRPLHELERELWGVTHAQLSTKVIRCWGLPHHLGQAVAFHHDPWPVARTLPAAVVVSLANRLAHSIDDMNLEGMPQVATKRDLTFLGLGLGSFLRVAKAGLKVHREIQI